MIRHLHLQGWRAFEDLALDLDNGVTFVVAENGVGKTSLVQAAAWGLYGKHSGIDARSARRVGTGATSVELELELPDQRTLSIARHVQERSESVTASVDGAKLDEAGVAVVLADAFGASLEFLSKTTIITSDAVADNQSGAFQLRGHLCRVFGVDALQSAAEELAQLHNNADAAAKRVRQASRRAGTDLAQLRTELSQAEAAETEAATIRNQTRSVADAAEQLVREARDQEAARARALHARKMLSETLTTAREILGPQVLTADIDTPSALAALLDNVEAGAVSALDGHHREAALVSGMLTAVRAAADELHSAGALCPVCRRELSPDDLTHASQGHNEDLLRLSNQEHTLAVLVESEAAALNAIRTLQRQAARLPPIDTPPDIDVLGVEARVLALEDARLAAEQAVEHAAEIRARRLALSTQIAVEEQASRETREAFLAHRREAVTAIAAEVMRATADTILTERIDPLATEVSHRWKQVFGERGSLRLQPDGNLVLMRGVDQIPFSQFSSGEKVVSLLAARLLILGASTRASFVWLDEPLEHLDPPNRRLIASLVTAAGQHVRQILVTTYEESLARRLASMTDVHLRYIRGADH